MGTGSNDASSATKKREEKWQVRKTRMGNDHLLIARIFCHRPTFFFYFALTGSKKINNGAIRRTKRRIKLDVLTNDGEHSLVSR